VLHLHSTFDAGGKERRSVALMNRFGNALDHSVVSAQPGALGARSLWRGLSVHFPLGFPSLAGKPACACRPWRAACRGLT
jgi:hypothetical protein